MKQNYQPSLKINFLLNTLYEILCIITPLISAPYANNYNIKCNKKETPYVFLLSGTWGHNKEKHLRTTISEFTKVKFEDDEFTAPKNYDLFLTEQYGDYMQLPKDIESCYNKHRCIELNFGKY